MTKKIKKPISNIQEIQNSVKTLLANIRFASVDYPLQSIAITSAVPNEGKTTTIIELAKAIAASGNTVLLVEADMRRRPAASALGVHPTSGAYSVMVGNVGLLDAVAQTEFQRFSFLDIEPNIPNPADLLASKAYERLVDKACENFDYVLFDTPPVGTFVDAAVLSRVVDGVVFVVKIAGAKRDEILSAYDQLEKADANIIGACATFCEGTGSEYYYAYYNKKNERVNQDKEGKKSSRNRGERRETSFPGLTPATPSEFRESSRNAASRVRPGSHSVSDSQAWKRTAVQSSVRQARHTGTNQLKRQGQDRMRH